MKKMIKLYATSNKMINDIDALRNGVSRYIGRKWDNELKGFPATDEPSEVFAYKDYVLAVQRGDLIAADEETAAYCSVPFSLPFYADDVKVGENYRGRL